MLFFKSNVTYFHKEKLNLFYVDQAKDTLDFTII
jgi:hypothetical protein